MNKSDPTIRRWTGMDTRWVFTLFGTAVGAGILYLPITMAVAGIWALIFMSAVILPMTYLSHRALCRFVLAADRMDGDITEAVEDHFGKGTGFAITLIYFMTLYSICLVYSIGITNEFNAFLVNILGVGPPPRWFVSLILILSMTAVVMFGTHVMTRFTSALVFPLIVCLFVLSLLGIPYWKNTVFQTPLDWSRTVLGILMGIPILVFAMNFSPVISTFSVAYRKAFTDPVALDRQTGKVIGLNSLMLFFFVLFFVFSIMLGLKPERLQDALSRNLSALAAITTVQDLTFIPLMASLVAMTAIISSFFGHLSGSREGLNGLVIKFFRRSDRNRPVNTRTIDRVTVGIHAVSMWVVAVFDVTIVDVINAFTAPFIAMILYLMPVYAFYRVPKLALYRKPINVLVFIMGIIVVSGYFITMGSVEP